MCYICTASINPTFFPVSINCEAVACKIILNNHCSLIVCSFYRPPYKDVESLQRLTSLFETLADDNPSTPIWITGDLNLPHIDWSSNNMTLCGNNYPKVMCNLVLDFLSKYGFSRSVCSPTRGNHILDVFSQIVHH